jgi:cell division protein FtsZ
LLSDIDITGACSILLNISSGEQTITLDEIGDINDYIQSAAGSDTNIIWGNCTDPQLGDAVRVTVIATGFVGGPIEATRRTLDAPAESAELAQHRGAAGEAPKASHEHQQPELASGARLELREGKQILVHTLDPQGPQSSQNTSSPRQTPVQTVDQAHSQGQTQAAPDDQQPKVDLSPKMSSPEAVQKATHQSAEANATPPMGEPKTLREHLFGDRSPSKALMDFFGSNAKKDDASNETESRPSVQQTSTSPISMSSPPPMAQAAHEDVLGRSERRRQTLRGLSFRGHDASGPGEVRHEPAFMRKGVQLTAVEPSDAQPISRFTLSESPDQRPEIRENNAFLHNNVD